MTLQVNKAELLSIEYNGDVLLTFITWLERELEPQLCHAQLSKEKYIRNPEGIYCFVFLRMPGADWSEASASHEKRITSYCYNAFLAGGRPV